MERLICLLPIHPDEPWDKMSDQYNSSLWDIYPDTQVCGIGENDTIIVDGFKGALIQWSMFSTVHTMKRTTCLRATIIWTITYAPVLFLIAVTLLVIPKKPVRSGGGVVLAIVLIILLSAPLYIPRLFNGKLYEVEPCLFGIEGYVPIQEVEEMIFGVRLGRLKWSAYGSPLSRHKYRRGYRERTNEDDVEAADSQPLLARRGGGENSSNFVLTYPVEAIDPCSPCENCENGGDQSRCRHATFAAVDARSKGGYGTMKVCSRHFYCQIPSYS